MAGKRQMDRKDFLALTLTSVGAGAWLLACGSGDEDDGTGGTGGTGGPAAGTGGTGPRGGTGPTGGGGTGPTGTGGTGPRGGTGPTGSGGTGPTGTGGTGAGGTGAGGTGAGGTGAGGTGAGGTGAGGAGAGGGSGGSSSANCVSVTFEQTNDWPHDHIPAMMDARDDFLEALAAHINGPMATMPFTTPMEGTGGGHTHEITFTAEQITTLKGGGTVTITKARNADGVDDEHVWDISCG